MAEEKESSGAKRGSAVDESSGSGSIPETETCGRRIFRWIGNIVFVCGLVAVLVGHAAAVSLARDLFPFNSHLRTSLNTPAIDVDEPIVQNHPSMDPKLSNRCAARGMNSPLYGMNGLYMHFNRHQYEAALRDFEDEEIESPRWAHWILPLVNASIDLDCCNYFITNLVMITAGVKEGGVSGWHTDNRQIFYPMHLPKTTPYKVTLTYAHIPDGMQYGRLFVQIPHTNKKEVIVPHNGRVVSIRGDTLHAIEAWEWREDHGPGNPELPGHMRGYRVTFVLEQHRYPESSLKFMPEGFHANPTSSEILYWRAMATLSALLLDGRSGGVFCTLYTAVLPNLLIASGYYTVATWTFGRPQLISLAVGVLTVVVLVKAAGIVDQEMSENKYFGYDLNEQKTPSVREWLLKPMWHVGKYELVVAAIWSLLGVICKGCASGCGGPKKEKTE